MVESQLCSSDALVDLNASVMHLPAFETTKSSQNLLYRKEKIERCTVL